MSTPHLLIFGLGYTASRFAARVAARGWDVTAVTRDGRADTLAITDTPGVAAAIRSASHILSSVPPDADGRDAVLDAWGEAVALAPGTARKTRPAGRRTGPGPAADRPARVK